MAIHTDVPFFKNAGEFKQAIDTTPVLDALLRNASLCEHSELYENGYRVVGEIPNIQHVWQLRNALANVATDIFIEKAKGSTTAACRVIIHAEDIEIVNSWVERYLRRYDLQKFAQDLKKTDPKRPFGKLGIVPRFPPDRHLTLYSDRFLQSVRSMPLMAIAPQSRKTTSTQVTEVKTPSSVLTFPGRPSTPAKE